MHILIRPFQLIYAVYAMISFVLLMIPVFIWGLLVLPFGRIRAGNLIYYACMVWADVWMAMVFIHHKNIYLQKLRKGQSYIYVANHISYLDAAILPKTIRHAVRPLGKVETTKVPVFGFIYKMSIVSVDRSSPENRIKSVITLKALLKKGISVLVFPEGTFNKTQKPLKSFYDGAFRMAIETGTPIKPVLLLNSYDRMHYNSILSLNPGPSSAIFLPEVGVKGLNANDVGMLKERVYKMMEEELIRRKAKWIGGEV